MKELSEYLYEQAAGAEKDVGLRGGDSRRRRRVHFSQYRDEHQQMKRARASHAPFFESRYAVARALP